MKIDFDKNNGLVPAIVQDQSTGKVLMLGYMNQEAIDQTHAIGKVTFFSRSKQRLWTKGESSGNYFLFKSMAIDCDQDTLLIKALPLGPACHTGADTCFQELNAPNYGFLSDLTSIIKDRKINPDDKSYVSSLFKKGINKIAQKVGEEAVETVIEAKDSDDGLFKNEAADLLFHLMILLEAKNFTIDDIAEILKNRHNSK